MSGYQISEPPSYLSAASANALISDIQPTSIHPQTLQHINLFLDEILYTLLSASDSLNPSEIRSTGVPAVFSADKSSESTAIRSLGRSAVGEAELELRSWVESNGSLKEGFGRDGKGNGMKRGGFALKQAFEVLRGRCEEFSTLAGEEAPRVSMENQRTAAWVAAGGDGEDVVLSPAALYTTAILEHVCEHVLAALARVVGRDSDNTTASLEDLFTAVAEDDGIWGFFKRMQVRVSLEDAIKSRQRRAHPSRPADRAVSRYTQHNPDSQTSLIQSSSSGAIREQDSGKKSSLPPSSYDHPRPSHDASRSGIAGGISNSIRKSPSLASTARFGAGIGPSRDSHVRSSSVLSASTRNMIGAYNDQAESGSQFGRSRRDEEDDFDALVASGETMKVSLTPSRLKNFDGSRRKNSSPNQGSYARRDRPSGASPPGQDDLPPLLPRGSTPSQTPDETPPRSTSLRSREAHNLTVTAAQRKLQPRGASIVPETDDSEDLADELESPFKMRKGGGGRANKESLAELLASTGPAPPPGLEHLDGHGEVKRTVPAVILGTKPPRYDDQPSEEAAGGAKGSVNRPGRAGAETSDSEDMGQPKKRTPAREMADFFDDGPPNSGDAPATAHSSVLPGSSKPKTPAQEMADFLNNTPAPPSSSAPPARFGAPVENLAPPPAKKGFKGFISKIGGGGKRKGSADQSAADETGIKAYKEQARANSVSQQGEAPQGLEGKRQKSLANMPTSASQGQGQAAYGAGGTSASSIADAYRTQQQARIPAELSPLLPTSNTVVESPPIPQPTTVTPTAQKRLSANSMSDKTGSGLTRKASSRKPVPYADAGLSPEVPASPIFANPSPTIKHSPTLDRSLSPGGRAPSRKPSTVDEDAGDVRVEDSAREKEGVPSPTEEARAARAEDPVREKEGVPSLREEKSSDQLSFATALEGQAGSPTPPEEAEESTPRVVDGHIMADPLGTGEVDSVPEAESARAGVVEEGPKGDAELDTVPEAAAIREDAKSDTFPSEPVPVEPIATLTPISEESAKQPSIPLAELLPLRHLLDGATSVRECQLLLSAILSQWGVPSAAGDEKVEPESRIAAWLLAGRDGPVGDVSAKGQVHDAGRKAESEGTAVALSEGKEEGGVTVAGVVEDIKTLAADGLGKVF